MEKRENDGTEHPIKDEFSRMNVLFASNGDYSRNDGILGMSMFSYSDCVSNGNFIVVESDGGKWFGKSAFIEMFKYGIKNGFSYIVYIDADCFIANSRNLLSLFKKFVRSGCIIAGPSDGGLFCHRNKNRFSINPFLMFVDLKRISEKFMDDSFEFSFNGSKTFDEKNVTAKSIERYSATTGSYSDFRKSKIGFSVPHSEIISRPNNEYEKYFGSGQVPWSTSDTKNFEPYYDIFLAVHDGEDSVYYMYGRDYPCEADSSGITSAVYVDERLFDDSSLVCLHAWFTRFANTGLGGFYSEMSDRIRRVGRLALSMNNKTQEYEYAISKAVRPSIKVLCVFHMDCEVDQRISDKSVYLPVFGGKCLYSGSSETVKSMIGDDTGENMSSMNPYINEMTVLYWAWKNYESIGNPEYIGLNHYRRFLKWGYGDLGKRTILAFRNDLNDTVYKQYASGHVVRDLDCFLKHLREEVVINHADMDRLERFLNGRWFYSNNMFIMPKSAFFEYMEFMYKCITICKKMIDSGEIDLSWRTMYQRRACSFILERMTGFKILSFAEEGRYAVKNIERLNVNCD